MHGMGRAVCMWRLACVGGDLTLEDLTGGTGGFLGPASCCGTLGPGSPTISHAGPLVCVCVYIYSLLEHLLFTYPKYNLTK